MREAKHYRNARIWRQFLAGGRTLKDIGHEHGISLERVRQIIYREAHQRRVPGWSKAKRVSEIRDLVEK